MSGRTEQMEFFELVFRVKLRTLPLKIGNLFQNKEFCLPVQAFQPSSQLEWTKWMKGLVNLEHYL